MRPEVRLLLLEAGIDGCCCVTRSEAEIGARAEMQWGASGERPASGDGRCCLKGGQSSGAEEREGSGARGAGCAGG